MPKKNRKVSKRRGPGKAAMGLQTYRIMRSLCSGQLTDTALTASGGNIYLGSGDLLTIATPAIAGGAYYGAAFGFCIKDCAAYTDFTSLFQAYRLDKVDIELVPMYRDSITPATAGNGTLSGFLHSVIDYDDNNAPAASTTGIRALTEYQSYKCQPLTETLRFTLVPRLRAVAESTSLTNGYIVGNPTFVSTADVDIPHFGMKWCFEVINPSASGCYLNFRMNLRYHFTFRSVH